MATAHGLCVRIGTAADNELQLTDSHVSRHHAIAIATPQGWHVYDLGSTNGVFVNGKDRKQAIVGPDDELTLGRSCPVGLEQLDAVASWPTGKETAFLRVGKADDNDIVRAGEHVSRYHALLAMREGELSVYDTGSLNGVFVNGEQVQHASVSDADQLTLGQSCAVFIPVARRRFEERAADTRVDEERGKSGKTTWLSKQLDNLRKEQEDHLRELEAERQTSEQRMTGRVRTMAVGAAAVVVAAVAVVILWPRGESELIAKLEETRGAVVMIVYEVDGPVVAGGEGLEYFSQASGDVLYASGFVCRHRGRSLVITNKHVVQSWLSKHTMGDPKGMTVRVQGSATTYAMTVAAVHPSQDVAVLAFVDEAPPGPALELESDWSVVKDGDVVGCMSFPLAKSDQRGPAIKADLTLGKVTNKFPDVVKYNLVSAPGSSGGPIFNATGRVIAVNQGQSADQEVSYQGMNWGVPARFVTELLQEL